MPGEPCLQGGAEFQPGCESMDTAMLRRPDGVMRRVLVAPFAGRQGREREVAGANARRWYLGLGAREVATVLHEDDLAQALADSELLVLPGGSPDRLLEALLSHTASLRAAIARGMVVSGSSAGAMVLCSWTVLPGRVLRVVPALGLAAVDLVVPHYRGGASSWADAAWPALPTGAVVLGLPERSGVVVHEDATWYPAGVEPPAVLTPQA